MKIEMLHEKVIAAAKANPPSQEVPYCFEKRIMAQISAPPTPIRDSCSIWGAYLWRAAAPCIAFALLVSAWTFYSPPNNGHINYSQEVESVLLAGFENLGASW